MSGRPPLPTILIVGVLFLLGGCGPKKEQLKLVPVSGSVKVGDQPLDGGYIRFIADPSQGNAVKANPTGKIKDGRFELRSNGEAGAPLGKYKVTIISQGPGMDLKSRFVVDQKYASIQKTPISVEVVENPAEGTYDFKVTAKTK
jgi:hypothetical protein